MYIYILKKTLNLSFVSNLLLNYGIKKLNEIFHNPFKIKREIWYWMGSLGEYQGQWHSKTCHKIGTTNVELGELNIQVLIIYFIYLFIFVNIVD